MYFQVCLPFTRLYIHTDTNLYGIETQRCKQINVFSSLFLSLATRKEKFVPFYYQKLKISKMVNGKENRISKRMKAKILKVVVGIFILFGKDSSALPNKGVTRFNRFRVTRSGVICIESTPKEALRCCFPSVAKS